MFKYLIDEKLTELLEAYNSTFDSIKAKDALISQVPEMEMGLESMKNTISEMNTLVERPADANQHLSEVLQVTHYLDNLYKKALVEKGFEVDFLRHSESVANIKNTFGWGETINQELPLRNIPSPPELTRDARSAIFGWDDKSPIKK